MAPPPMGNLPDEIMRDIIAALPAKSLVRFRCVRKSWRTLISGPDLIRANLNHFSSRVENHSLLIKRTSIGSSKSATADYFIRLGGGGGGGRFEPEFDEPSSRYLRFSQMPYIVGSCNGLLCLYSGSVEDPSKLSICICNPSIMECRIIPNPESNNFASCFTYHLGFGFHPVSPNFDDYKVVKISNMYYGLKSVEVYSLRRNSWKAIGNTLDRNLRIEQFEQSLMFNGRVHWRVTRPGGANKAFIWGILCFDLVDEVFEDIELPEVHAPPSFPPILCDVVLEGCLGVLDHWDNLWVMKEYGVVESWTRLYAIRRESIGLNLRPLGFTCSGEVILEKRSDGWLYSYDPKSERLEDIILPSSYSKPLSCKDVVVSMVTYVESLVSVFPNPENNVQFEQLN